jgi:hypothetical protein
VSALALQIKAIMTPLPATKGNFSPLKRPDQRSNIILFLSYRFGPAETPITSSTNSKYPTPTGTVSASNIKCPAANHAEYAAQEYENATLGVGTNFLVLCNTDYSAINGTVDLISDEVKDVAECFDWCSATTGCVGAGFAFYNEKYTCWLKSSLGEPTLLSAFYFGLSETEYLP